MATRRGEKTKVISPVLEVEKINQGTNEIEGGYEKVYPIAEHTHSSVPRLVVVEVITEFRSGFDEDTRREVMNALETLRSVGAAEVTLDCLLKDCSEAEAVELLRMREIKDWSF